MRFRSAGLGPTELKGRISNMAPVGDELLVLHIKTSSPVQWHLKAAMERQDIPKVVKGIMRPAVILHIIRVLLYVKKHPKEPKDIMDKSIAV